MKNLVYLLFLALVAFGAVGYFLNWYQFTDTKSTTGHRRLTLDIDANKVREDVQKGETKLNQALENYRSEPLAPSSAPTPVDSKQLTPPQLTPPK
jgi:hypothetical protein